MFDNKIFNRPLPVLGQMRIGMRLPAPKYELKPVDTAPVVRNMKHGGMVYGRMPKLVSKKNLIH